MLRKILQLDDTTMQHVNLSTTKVKLHICISLKFKNTSIDLKYWLVYTKSFSYLSKNAKIERKSFQELRQNLSQFAPQENENVPVMFISWYGSFPGYKE